MKTLSLLIAVVASLPSLAADDAAGDPGTVAEKFYAGYVAQVEANKDTKAWVAGSKLVTANFKKACAKAMNAKEVVADPACSNTSDTAVHTGGRCTG